MNHRISYPFLIYFLFILLNSSLARTGDYVYFLNFVRHSGGDICDHLPPQTTFTAYLNNDQSHVLIESSPRWDPGADPNIPGSGVFGIELGNFVNPSLAVGDSIFVRFTCNSVDEQGTASNQVTAIPWLYFPVTLYLQPLNIPSPPQNVSVTLDLQHRRIISWMQEPGITYSVYRQVIQDTIFNRQSRRMYYRIAENLSTSSFTDSTTTDTVAFGYIVYAKNGEGVLSSHSREVLGGETIANLSVSPGATTAMLQWDSYIPPIGQLKGYNIYRRKVGGIFGEPIAYTGLDTTFIDSRLQHSTVYYYKVSARIDPVTEFGETPEVSLTTQSSSQGYYTYANFKVAVVIYKNTNAGGISSSEVNKIKTMLEVAKLFYWRNSKMKLNLEFTYYPINEYINFGDPNNLNIQQTVSDLTERGVMNTQYDIIFRITRATHGYWSVGVTNLAFPGPSRKTGFSQSAWPVGTGVVYPGHQSGINYGLTWTFVHECQHAIDALYNENGHPEMGHGDAPWEFPVACGEHYDFQAKMFRTFISYEDLLPNWGDIYEAIDADEDGFPDNESLAALDELRFGSSAFLSDTDGDFYSDRQEAIDGTYTGSNPVDQDTDNDGIEDGADAFPRYPLQRDIQSFTPLIDGNIEAGWPLINDEVVYTQESYSPHLYLTYNPDSLYLALHLQNYGVPRISFDFHGDGWWHSSGNTSIRVNPVTGSFSEFHSWDASNEVKNFSLSNGGPGGMWDDDPAYIQQFNRRVIYPDSVNLAVNYNFPVVKIEMAIPRTPYAGLLLQTGDRIGLNISYSNVNNMSSQWAVTFDQYNFANVIIGGSSRIDTAEDIQVAYRFNLRQNYPNPFNPSTQINYEIPEKTGVKLIIFNTLGQKIKTLVNAYQSAGKYSVFWDGKNDSGRSVSSGIYLYRLETGQNGQIRKMILCR